MPRAHICCVAIGDAAVAPLSDLRVSAAQIRYVVKYQFGGSSHYGTIQIQNGDWLILETAHGSKTASLNPKSDLQSLVMILLLELGAKLVSIDTHSS
ncbi:hypothetical protein JQ554_22720 [Bradyrhizobium diazoefficiens]|nr:hypothetical protein [Bradyrhizobium diazoefficiens]UCF53587.1 MAG: hypothetical protein JSV48_03860 [Bradyrhizobium sp.]MBR0966863.1 hypothetical protein [Bradyrhizobium diazoefficiens]MBR0980501.1 hypothetical protein [Bradyrhizobium diazoefficiens]MBR1009849.1 hypothetical protein [Bradyrhizobium diazoefficiens]MBR1016432.1 hypothetical protein [Bradyrhizobium diazoefficiens]